MANPWKDFKPLPPSRQRRDDTIFAYLYTIVGVAAVGAVLFALGGGIAGLVIVSAAYEDSWNEDTRQYEMTSEQSLRVLKNSVATGGAIGAVLGGVGALGAVTARERKPKKRGDREADSDLGEAGAQSAPAARAHPDSD